MGTGLRHHGVMKNQPRLTQILAENVNRLMAEKPELGSNIRLEKASGIGHSTINRILNAQVSTTLDKVEALAGAFRVEPIDLLTDSRAAKPRSFMDIRGDAAKLLTLYEDLTDEAKAQLINIAYNMRQQRDSNYAHPAKPVTGQQAIDASFNNVKQKPRKTPKKNFND